MKWLFVGLGALSAIQFAFISRNQRVGSRALARSEERLALLDLRTREEGDNLHQRALESIQREGVLQQTLIAMHHELALLRASIDALVVPVGAELVPVVVAPELPQPVLAEVANQAHTFEVALVQRTFAAAEAADGALPAPEAPAPVAFEPAAASQPVPTVEPVPAAQPAADLPASVPPSTWVVREIQVDEPATALTMRILDLTSDPVKPGPASQGPASQVTEPQGSPESADPRPADPWQVFARPA